MAPSLRPEGTVDRYVGLGDEPRRRRDGEQHDVRHLAAVGTSMDQRHVNEVHGSEGTLRYLVDWDEVQVVLGSRIGEGAPSVLESPTTSGAA